MYICKYILYISIYTWILVWAGASGVLGTQIWDRGVGGRRFLLLLVACAQPVLSQSPGAAPTGFGGAFEVLLDVFWVASALTRDTCRIALALTRNLTFRPPAGSCSCGCLCTLADLGSECHNAHVLEVSGDPDVRFGLPKGELGRSLRVSVVDLLISFHNLSSKVPLAWLKSHF